MKLGSTIVGLAALLSTAVAQYAIDPNSVSNTTRLGWCEQQQYQCPLICLQETNGGSASTESNTCDSDSLTYSCVCQNGLSPNVSEYSQTLPYFICTEWGTQCVSNCGQDNNCAHDCRANHPCGAQNPTRYNTSTSPATTTTSDGGSATAGVVYTGLGDGSASSATGAASRHMMPAASQLAGFGQAWGVIGLIAAFFGGFALLL